MKALVTGASGFVGRHLVAALRDSGWRVLTADRHGPADLRGDLLRLPLRGIRVDVVFHLAGFANPSASREDSRAAYDGNAAVTARLTREVRAGRFVIASTSHVYGARSGRSTESTPLRPRSPYAASKLCAEALALGSGQDVVVLRPYNHTGPGQSDAYVCPHIARQISRAEAGLGPPTVALGALAPCLDLFDVRDMARAYLLSAEKARPGGIYNVATGRPVSIGKIARMMISRSRVPLQLRSPQGRPDVVSGDSSKLRAATGWRPLIPLRQTLQDLLDHERARVARRG